MKTYNFNSNATELDLNNAYWLANFAKMSYKNEKEIYTFYRSLSMKVDYYHEKGNECTLAYNDNDIFIAFSGTTFNEWLDILDDIDAKCIRHTECGCAHEGFYIRAIHINSWLVQKIMMIQDDGKQRKIWITGHSLGGAVAIISSTLLNFEIAGIYTFGQPRVGDRKFVKCFDETLGSKTFRFVHTCDIVPRLPSVLSGYRNNQTMVYINHKDKIENLNFFKRTIDRLKDFLINIKKTNVPHIQEHFINSYINVIVKLLDSK